jgi:hypothetical protein
MKRLFQVLGTINKHCHPLTEAVSHSIDPMDGIISNHPHPITILLLKLVKM